MEIEFGSLFSTAFYGENSRAAKATIIYTSQLFGNNNLIWLSQGKVGLRKLGDLGAASAELHLMAISLPPQSSYLRDYCSRTPGASLHEYHVILIKDKNM
jgi:hypothetical protein